MKKKEKKKEKKRKEKGKENQKQMKKKRKEKGKENQKQKKKKRKKKGKEEREKNENDPNRTFRPGQKINIEGIFLQPITSFHSVQLLFLVICVVLFTTIAN